MRVGKGVSANLPVKRSRQRWPAAQLLADLDREFEKSIAACTKRTIFTGPSVHFYERTVRMVREAASLRDLARSEMFCDYVYATLTAWGMHRMGERVAAKLTAFPTFQAALCSLLKEVDDLRGMSVCDLTEEDTVAVTSRLAKLAETTGITASNAPLVANTKTLHFLLPDLVPPIDRTYTCRFFFGRMQPPGSAAEVFRRVYPRWQRSPRVMRLPLGRRPAPTSASGTRRRLTTPSSASCSTARSASAASPGRAWMVGQDSS